MNQPADGVVRYPKAEVLEKIAEAILAFEERERARAEQQEQTDVQPSSQPAQ